MVIESVTPTVPGGSVDVAAGTATPLPLLLLPVLLVVPVGTTLLGACEVPAPHAATTARNMIATSV